MKNRSFLLPLTVLAAALLSQNSTANVAIQEDKVSPPDGLNAPDVNRDESRVTSKSISGDLFSFILRRQGDGTLMAAHESHQSHESHRSHRSHYSGY